MREIKGGKCPICFTQRRHLYVSSGTTGCYKCWKFTKIDKLRMKSQKIRLKLKETQDFRTIHADFIVQPPHFTQKAFENHINKLRSLEDEITLLMIKDLERLIAKNSGPA